MTNPQWTLWAHCQCTSYHVRDLEWPWESNLFAYPRCLLVFTHVHDSEGDLVRLRAPHERPYNRTMSAMWIYKLPWETLSDLESHYICFEFVIIRVMGKCFVINHAGQFQCSKEITWTCCHQKRKYCHFSTVKSCWEFMNICKCTAWLSIFTGSIFHFQYTPIDRG